MCPLIGSGQQKNSMAEGNSSRRTLVYVTSPGEQAKVAEGKGV